MVRVREFRRLQHKLLGFLCSPETDLASFEIQSALMKNLHRRLRQEGIVINYPVRTLQFPDGLNPQTVPQPGDLSKLSRTHPRNQQRRRRPTRAGTHIFPNPDVQGGDAGDGPGLRRPRRPRRLGPAPGHLQSQPATFSHPRPLTTRVFQLSPFVLVAAGIPNPLPSRRSLRSLR